MLVSGGGSNLQSLLDALGPGAPARITHIVSNRPDARALDRARRAGIPATVLHDPADADELLRALADVDLVVLAGYLKLLPARVVARFRQRAINIHPALLPDFGGPGMYGRRVHEAVLASGATRSGATVHYVDEQFDRGPIIAQRTVPVFPDDTADSLAQRVLALEHELLPAVVIQLAQQILRRGE